MRTPREVVGELVAIHGDETALALFVDVNKGTINRWMNGEVERLDDLSLAKVALKYPEHAKELRTHNESVALAKALDGAPRRKREGGTFTVTGLDKTQRELLARVVAAMSSTAWREPWASYTVSMIEAAAEAELRARPLQARKNG